MKKAVFLYLVCLLAPLSAQTLQQGFYACNGTAYTMQITVFGAGGMATLYEDGKVISNATIKTSGGNLAFSFVSGGGKYQGKTWVYVQQSAVSFEGNGEYWFRIGDGQYSVTGPTAPAPGSITQPPAASGSVSAVLQSGSYTLSGSRQRIALSLSGRHGGGTLYDDQGRSAGEFRAAVNGQSLSITYISGPHSGITYDYRITGETSFSRPGEMWARRY